MQLNISHLCRAILALALMATTATAVTVHPLVGDGAAMWTGTQPFAGNNALFTHTVTATVDFAVYSPGQFYASTALNLPTGTADPSLGTEYVYAYEIFTGALSDSVVGSLSVGIDPGHVFATSTNIKNYSFSPELGLAPIPGTTGNKFIKQTVPVTAVTNAFWTFPSPQIVQGSHSDIVLFTSPYGPVLHGSSIVGGNATNAGAQLPSPAPEPGTLALAASAVVCLLATRCLRRRNTLR